MKEKLSQKQNGSARIYFRRDFRKVNLILLSIIFHLMQDCVVAAEFLRFGVQDKLNPEKDKRQK